MSKDQATSHGAAFDHNSPRPPVPGEEKSHFSSEFAVPSSPVPKRNFLGTRSPPACLRWTQSLHALLQDVEGVKLFRQYLESEGKQHSDALDFWFACQGLRKQQGLDKIMQLVKLIYKKFFVKSVLPVADEVRKEIGQIVKSSQCLEPPVTLFDRVQAQIEHLIVTTTYPNFLKSDMYLQFVENAQSSTTTSSSGSSSEFSSSNELSNLAGALDPLPTLHEDMELIMNPSGHLKPGTGYHTPSASLRLTKDILLMSQSRRAVDRSKSETFASMFVYRGGAHAAYNSYNPVSRQDSELHSLSSHSDARTESDNLSLTDSSIDGRSMGRTTRRQAALNREIHMNQIVIPRTQRVDKTQCQPMDPDKFASILIGKLEAVKKHQDSKELLDRKLKEGQSLPSINDPTNILLDDENDQSILDDHVSLVFPDTPARSPGVTSPHKNRHLQSSSRRRKDVGGSIFSSDSGNVHDFAEEHKIMVKSKSMPEDRFGRRSSSSKKTLTDLTDSGVSVVSDAPPAVAQVKDSRVMAWLMSGHNDACVKKSSYRTSSATSPISNRHKKGFGSRSSSVERSSVSGGNLIGGEAKAPLPPNSTLTQLEEARRRLLEDDLRTRTKQRSTSSRHYPDLTSQSSQSTLRKSQRGARPSLPSSQSADDLTTVVFSFCDEQFPYRTKIPGTQITLKQFKDYLPKKGNYRFFFKTVCEDLGNQVIQEEVSNDSDILPLWEGKIMAQVKPID